MHNVINSDQEILENGSDLSDPFLDIPPPLSQTLQLDEIPDPKPLTSTTFVSPIPETPAPSKPPAAKKRKVSTQDIQQLQFEVLNLEKTKIELEVQNLKLANEKLLLENNLFKSQGVFNQVEQ